MNTSRTSRRRRGRDRFWSEIALYLEFWSIAAGA
jgi:hypothetical protein